MRRLSVALVISALLLALPAAAAAAPPQRGSDDVTFIYCDQLQAAGGRTVTLLAEVSQQWGSFGFMEIEQAGELVATSADAEVTLSGDGSTLGATYELYDVPMEVFLGSAELTALLTPVGDPEAFDDRFRDGNRQFRSSGTFQAYSPSGEVVLPDGEAVDLSPCFAGRAVYTFFSSNPAASIYRNQGIFLNCSWETDDGFVGLFATAERWGTFSDIFLAVDDTFVWGFDPNATLTETAFSTSMDLEDDFETVVGSATASATISATGERLRFRDRFGRSMFKFFGERLSVDGTLHIALNGGIQLSMDDESCSATVGRSMELSVQPAGPKPRPLANDTPEGAKELRIGRSDRVVTGANAEEPEEPCVAGIDPETGEVFDYPITYTAWWTFTGTGGEVTVSTSASDFDTIVGVYQLVEGELVQVACVDDVHEPDFSLQAEVAISTEIGATYYIQAGGYGGSTGRLVVSLR
jgi:hypothetical protein